MLRGGVIAATVAVAVMSTAARAQTSGQPAPVESGYASVNGLALYYEIHGEGDPLVMLH